MRSHYTRRLNLMTPLTYEISKWYQLNQCKSNYSNDLSIRVSDFLNDPRLSATRITVHHNLFGDLYTVLVDASGTILNSADSVEFQTPSDILSSLEKFGFLVQFSQRKHLSGNQLQKLMTLQTIGFDKIRPLEVYDSIKKVTEKYIVAFIVEKNPKWLYINYRADKSEFLSAIHFGNAMNISAISYYQDMDWTWLDYVANISDILEDNI